MMPPGVATPEGTGASMYPPPERVFLMNYYTLGNKYFRMFLDRTESAQVFAPGGPMTELRIDGIDHLLEGGEIAIVDDTEPAGQLPDSLDRIQVGTVEGKKVETKCIWLPVYMSGKECSLQHGDSHRSSGQGGGEI